MRKDTRMAAEPVTALSEEAAAAVPPQPGAWTPAPGRAAPARTGAGQAVPGRAGEGRAVPAPAGTEQSVPAPAAAVEAAQVDAGAPPGGPRAGRSTAGRLRSDPARNGSATVGGGDTPSDLLRSVFRRHAAGVAVITAGHQGRPFGFTATSLTSVSAEPALVSFGISERSSCWPAVARAEYVGVHLLGEHQSELAATFARSGADRFAPPTAWREGPEGVPVLDGVVAWLVCRPVARIPAGDHRIVVAAVVAGDPSGEGRPLLYHQGRFGGLRP